MGRKPRVSSGRLRKHAISATTCILIGAMINVLIAWWFALGTDKLGYPEGKWPYFDEQRNNYGFAEYASPNESQLWMWLTLSPGQKAAELELFNRELDLSRYPGVSAPEPVTWGQPLERHLRELFRSRASYRFDGGSKKLKGAIHIFGWPFKSLSQWHAQLEQPEGPSPLFTYFDCIKFKGRFLGAWRPRLPLSPLPLGFIANTLIFGLLVYISSYSPGVVVRCTRSLRNRCPKCGYTLAGLTEARCPECGRAFKPTPHRPQRTAAAAERTGDG